MGTPTGWEPSGWQGEGEDYEPPASAEDWRGDEHLGDWPESLAGPEYWLYKRNIDEQGN
jgi:hypothetical protein